MGLLSLEPHAAGQLMFDLGVAEEEEGHREGAPPFASAADRAGPGDTAPAASSAAARSPTRGYRQVKSRPEDEWTPERVRSYLSGLGLHPDNLVVGPDMLKELPFGGVRQVDWAEGARRACLPLQFLPGWRWEPYFVTAFGQEGLILGRPWVALAREPSGTLLPQHRRRGFGRKFLHLLLDFHPRLLCVASEDSRLFWGSLAPAMVPHPLREGCFVSEEVAFHLRACRLCAGEGHSG
ncbi:MAG: hypothetical protein AB1609_17785 [Bacillota bacterium]